EVIVKDALGQSRSAGLFYMSPEQINYLVPLGTSVGTATVTVRRSGADDAQGQLPIELVAPGFFSANSKGSGLAAAAVLRRRDGQPDTLETVAQLNVATSSFDPVLIDFGGATDQLFLILYGTGFRGRSALPAVTCTIGGTPVDVLYAGVSPDFFGL